mmetsp:Transcript_40675/g.41530  ORF Transcript_40675/g.41530 Transcript_40675/m.41530 type:complete len:696 (-) Transcript_40675:122-2209(-)
MDEEGQQVELSNTVGAEKTRVGMNPEEISSDVTSVKDVEDKSASPRNDGSSRNSFTTGVFLLQTDFFCDDMEVPQVDEYNRLPFWKFPKKGQKVFYPQKWRKLTASGLENPFEYWAGGLWWWSWVVFGADPDTFEMPDDRMEFLANKFHWTLPPVGHERQWRSSDMFSAKLPKELLTHFNMQTIHHRIGIDKAVLWFLERKSVFGYLMMLALINIFLPGIWSIIIYGLIPVGDYLKCEFKEFAVWLFLTNPLTEVTWAFVDFSLMFACLDRNIPWRPFWMYLPALLSIYVFQVLFFLPIVLTVGTFTCQALVSRVLSWMISIVWYFLLKKGIFAFTDVYEVHRGNFGNVETIKDHISKVIEAAVHSDYVPTDEENVRFKAWIKVSFTKSVMLYAYSAYLIGYETGNTNLQTGLAFAIMAVSIAFRKFLQHFGAVFDRDMNFLISGLSVYTMHATFIAFSTPNVEMDGSSNYTTNWRVYLSLFLSPLGDVFISFFHQSNMWFRFRNWIKKIAKPVLLCARPTDYSAIAVEDDMDFDGRGITNAHPDYRRAKTYFDFLVYWGNIAGYGSYLLVSWIFKAGPNVNKYPFNNIPEFPELSFFPTRGFEWRDWGFSVLFSVVVVFTLAIGFVGYVYYLRKFYPDVWPCTVHSMYSFGRNPYKLGFAVLIVTVTLSDTIIMLLNFSRVWYYDNGNTFGNCT